MSLLARTFFLLSFLFIFTSGPLLAAESLRDQKLDVQASRVTSVLNSAMLRIAGTLTLHEGTLRIDPKSLEPKEVSLSFYPKNFKTEHPQQAEVLAGLLQGRSTSPVQFRSSAVRKIAQNRYQVVGHSYWERRRYDLQFQARKIRASQGRAEYEILLKGPIDLFGASAEGLGALATMQRMNGEMQGKLVFSSSESLR